MGNLKNSKKKCNQKSRQHLSLCRKTINYSIIIFISTFFSQMLPTLTLSWTSKYLGKILAPKKSHSMLRTILNASFETKTYFNYMKCHTLFFKRWYMFEDLQPKNIFLNVKIFWRRVGGEIGRFKQVGFWSAVLSCCFGIWIPKLRSKLHSIYCYW